MPELTRGRGLREIVPRQTVRGRITTRDARASDFDTGGGGVTQALGAGLREFGGLAGAIQARQERTELAHLQAAFATAQAQFNLELEGDLEGELGSIRNPERAGAAGGEFADRFVGKIDGFLNQLDEQVSSEGAKNFLISTGAKFRAHFLEAAVRGQGRAAKEVARAKLEESITGFTSSAYSNPYSMEHLLDLQRDGIEALRRSGAIPNDLAAGELQRRGASAIVTAAMQGLNDVDPRATLDRIKRGALNGLVDGDTLNKLHDEAERAIKIQEQEAKLEATARRVEESAAVAAQNRIDEAARVQFKQGVVDRIGSYLGGDLSALDTGVIEEIRKSDLKPEDKIRYFDLVGKTLRDDKGNPTQAGELEALESVRAGTIDEDGLVELNLRGEISDGALSNFKSVLRNNQREENRRVKLAKEGLLVKAKSLIVSENTFSPELKEKRSQRMIDFTLLVEQAIEQRRQDGKPLLDLFEPGNRDYVGNAMQQFLPSLEEAQREQFGGRPESPGTFTRIYQSIFGSPEEEAAPVAPVASEKPPAQPGESPADYLRRTRGGR